jgi:hypothetical protein
MHAHRFGLAHAPVLLQVHPLACSSHAPAGPPPDYSDVVFQGSATAGALTSMLAVTSTDDTAHVASFDNPKDLSALPGTPIITFTWHDAQVSAMQLLPRPREASFTGALADLFGERAAYAQGPAMSGTGYLLAFSNLDTGQPLFRVFTSSTSYTPDQTAWAKIATGNWTQLQIKSATFDADQLTLGPWNGQVIKFCIGWAPM